MNAIAAMARVAEDDPDLTENQRNILNLGKRSIKLLTSVIETILDFSKLDSGKLLLETDEFSVHELIEDIRNMAIADAEKKSLYFRIFIDKEVPEKLLGDSMRLQQILLNIVLNAVKFTETGGVEIHVNCKDNVNDTVMLIFEIKDTGIGITDEQKKELFKPMLAGDVSYARKYGGLGMGLAVSKGLVKLMGGEIACKSQSGHGSTFRLGIPFALPEKKDIAVAEKTPGLEVLCGMRVLVAEDNEINQIIIEELLSSAGIKAIMANNGIKALELLSKEKFDVVLMDIQMPGMDGLTATAQIRADPHYDMLPVIAMTANAGPEHLAESINAGMNDHLTKPIDKDQLYNTLKKYIAF
jgi:CheY-like chemotaxis protein